MIITAALLAIALDTQDTPPAALTTQPAPNPAVTAEIQERAAAYAEDIVTRTENLMTESGGHYTLVRRDELVAEMTTLLNTVIAYGDEPVGTYDMTVLSHFFSLGEGETPEGPFCAPGAESTMVDQPVTDENDVSLSFRGCWGGLSDPDSDRLVAGIIYQLDREGHFAQYQALISGPEQAGVGERLQVVEPVLGRLMSHTVSVPAAD